MSGHVFVATPSYREWEPPKIPGKFARLHTPSIVESFKVQVYDPVIFWALFMLYFYILILRITGSCKKEGAWMCFFAVVWDLQTTSDLRSEVILRVCYLMLFYFKCLKNLEKTFEDLTAYQASQPPRPPTQSRLLKFLQGQSPITIFIQLQELLEIGNPRLMNWSTG